MTLPSVSLQLKWPPADSTHQVASPLEANWSRVSQIFSGVCTFWERGWALLGVIVKVWTEIEHWQRSKWRLKESWIWTRTTGREFYPPEPVNNPCKYFMTMEDLNVKQRGCHCCCHRLCCCCCCCCYWLFGGKRGKKWDCKNRTLSSERLWRFLSTFSVAATKCRLNNVV